jgi:thiosulfate/3-mercaptopyruvate sulfurtransferase
MKITTRHISRVLLVAGILAGATFAANARLQRLDTSLEIGQRLLNRASGAEVPAFGLNVAAVETAAYKAGGHSHPIPLNSNGANSSAQMLVSVDWLANHLGDPSLVILEIGEKDGYQHSHIPGAQFLDYDSISTPMQMGKTLMLELPPIDQLVSVFEKLGVSNNSHIVLYFRTDLVTPTTRVYWTLDYMGLGANTSILDGGYPAWRGANKPITGDVKQAAKGTITAHPRTEIVANADWMNAHLSHPGTDIIDARAPEYYTGDKGDGTPRSGHIPGATNLPYTSLVDDADKFKDKDALEKLFRDAGIKPGDLVVSYCHIGQRATIIYFAAKLLGYNARMYDGSWEDWSQRKNLPIVTGSAPGKPPN